MAGFTFGDERLVSKNYGVFLYNQITCGLIKTFASFIRIVI